MLFGKKKTAELERKLMSVHSNMENNYHDAAKQSYEEALAIFKEKTAAGELSKKQIAKYQTELESIGRSIQNKGITHQTHAGW